METKKIHNLKKYYLCFKTFGMCPYSILWNPIILIIVIKLSLLLECLYCWNRFEIKSDMENFIYVLQISISWCSCNFSLYAYKYTSSVAMYLAGATFRVIKKLLQNVCVHSKGNDNDFSLGTDSPYEHELCICVCSWLRDVAVDCFVHFPVLSLLFALLCIILSSSPPRSEWSFPFPTLLSGDNGGGQEQVHANVPVVTVSLFLCPSLFPSVPLTLEQNSFRTHHDMASPTHR